MCYPLQLMSPLDLQEDCCFKTLCHLLLVSIDTQKSMMLLRLQHTCFEQGTVPALLIYNVMDYEHWLQVIPWVVERR